MKGFLFFLLFIIISTTVSFAQTATPAATPAPTMQGDLLWTREIYVYDSRHPDNPPLSGVIVTATALGTSTETTNAEGICEISVLAHDTGSVEVHAAKEGYVTFINTYPGLPVNGSISIGLPSVPVPEPGDQVGDVWIYPGNLAVSTGENFTVEIHANTGTRKLGAYGFDITFDPAKLDLIAVDPGADGFISAVGMGSPGFFIISGFDPSGTGPGSDMHVVSMIYSGNSEECGESTIQVEVDTLVDSAANNIGSPRGFAGTVITAGCLIPGDVDGNKTIDIIDALKTAQHYVGLSVFINPAAADVNCDGSITIVDALLIAQYYVEMIDTFCR